MKKYKLYESKIQKLNQRIEVLKILNEDRKEVKGLGKFKDKLKGGSDWKNSPLDVNIPKVIIKFLEIYNKINDVKDDKSMANSEKTRKLDSLKHNVKMLRRGFDGDSEIYVKRNGVSGFNKRANKVMRNTYGTDTSIKYDEREEGITLLTNSSYRHIFRNLMLNDGRVSRAFGTSFTLYDPKVDWYNVMFDAFDHLDKIIDNSISFYDREEKEEEEKARKRMDDDDKYKELEKRKADIKRKDELEANAKKADEERRLQTRQQEIDSRTDDISKL